MILWTNVARSFINLSFSIYGYTSPNMSVGIQTTRLCVTTRCVLQMVLWDSIFYITFREFVLFSKFQYKSFIADGQAYGSNYLYTVSIKISIQDLRLCTYAHTAPSTHKQRDKFYLLTFKYENIFRFYFLLSFMDISHWVNKGFFGWKKKRWNISYNVGFLLNAYIYVNICIWHYNDILYSNKNIT